MSEKRGDADEKENVDESAPVWKDGTNVNEPAPEEKQESEKIISAVDSNKQQRYWSTDDHIKYLYGLYKFGQKQVNKIAEEV